MSISEIRPYFRSKLVGLGYREHTDAFNFNNIPSTLINKSFHMENPSGGRRGIYTNGTQDIEQECVIRVFFKGYRRPAEAIDFAMSEYDRINAAVLANDARLQAGIKNIYLNDMSLRPYEASNDNLVMLEITYTVFLTLCLT